MMGKRRSKNPQHPEHERVAVSCCIRNYRNIFIVYSHHSYVIPTEGVNDTVIIWSIEHVEFEPAWIGHSIKLITPMNTRINTKSRELR